MKIPHSCQTDEGVQISDCLPGTEISLTCSCLFASLTLTLDQHCDGGVNSWRSMLLPPLLISQMQQQRCCKLAMWNLMWRKGRWLLPRPVAEARVDSRGAGRVSTVPASPSNLHSSPRPLEDLPRVGLWELLYRLTFQGFHSRTHELQVGPFSPNI